MPRKTLPKSMKDAYRAILRAGDRDDTHTGSGKRRVWMTDGLPRIDRFGERMLMCWIREPGTKRTIRHFKASEVEILGKRKAALFSLETLLKKIEADKGN